MDASTKHPKMPILEPGFKIREGGRITRFWQTHGIDLVIAQKFRGETVTFSHYSNPGFMTHTVFMKFLYAFQKLPEMEPAETSKSIKVYDDSALQVAAYIAPRNFPLQYMTSSNGPDWYPIVASISQNSLEPGLELEVRGERMMRFSLSAVRDAVINIPKMYPGLDSFSLAYSKLIEISSGYPDLVVAQQLQLFKPLQRHSRVRIVDTISDGFFGKD